MNIFSLDIRFYQFTKYFTKGKMKMLSTPKEYYPLQTWGRSYSVILLFKNFF